MSSSTTVWPVSKAMVALRGSTALTLAVLPGLLATLLRGWALVDPEDAEDLTPSAPALAASRTTGE